MKADTQYYKLTLIPITPIHIGSGDILDPYEYIICDDNSYQIVYKINLPVLIEVLTDKERENLEYIMDNNKLKDQQREIQQLAKKYKNSHPQIAEQFAQASEDFIKSVQNRQESKLEIHTMIREPNKLLPYIPGSSVKGSLRTAWLNHLAKEKHNDRNLQRAAKSKKGRLVEAVLLDNLRSFGEGQFKEGDVKKDPFRALQISDTAINDKTIIANTIARTEIIKRKKINRRNANPSKIQQYIDVFVPYDDEIFFTGKLAIHRHLFHATVKHKANDKPQKVITGKHFDVSELLNQATAFYRKQFEDERKKHYENNPNPVFGNIKPVLDEISEHFDNISTNTEAIIRIGRFSQFEFVTIDGLQHKPRRGAGNTRTLASSRDWFDCPYTPLGWCKLRLEPIK